MMMRLALNEDKIDSKNVRYKTVRLKKHNREESKTGAGSA